MKPLTSRETEAVMHIMQGTMMAQAAKKMGCRYRTVRFHLDNARRKLKAVNLPHLVAVFMEQQKSQIGNEGGGGGVMGLNADTVMELVEASRGVYRLLRGSYASTVTLTVHKTPAQLMRDNADRVEAEDAAISRFHSALDACEKELGTSGVRA